jgi:hypothetical protein
MEYNSKRKKRDLKRGRGSGNKGEKKTEGIANNDNES